MIEWSTGNDDHSEATGDMGFELYDVDDNLLYSETSRLRTDDEHDTIVVPGIVDRVVLTSVKSSISWNAFYGHFKVSINGVELKFQCLNCSQKSKSLELSNIFIYPAKQEHHFGVAMEGYTHCGAPCEFKLATDGKVDG